MCQLLKFTFFTCSVKIDLGPLNIFPVPTGETLPVEGTGETFQEERVLLPGSMCWLGRLLKCACLFFPCPVPPLPSSTQQPAAVPSTVLGWFCSEVPLAPASLAACPVPGSCTDRGQQDWGHQHSPAVHPPIFCSGESAERHLLVNTFPQHPREQISSKFQRADFQKGL